MSDTPYRHAFDSILIEQLQDAILEISGERDTARVEQNSALAERDTALAERDTARAERDTALAERDTALAERDTVRADLADVMGSRSWRSTAWARQMRRGSRPD